MRLPRSRKNNNRKRAISSVIGGIIILGMIISVGYGYFYSITQSQQYYQKEVKLYNISTQERQSEDLILSAAVSGSSFITSITNTAAEVNITAYFIYNNSTGTTTYNSIAGGDLVAQDQSVTITGGTYSQGDKYLIKILTGRGNVFTTTYPPTATTLASQALSSGAIGDLYLEFNSYHFFTISSGSGCPTGSNYSGYCLADQGAAFAVPYSTYEHSDIAFSVTMVDLNQQEGEIVLDQFSSIFQIATAKANAKGTPFPWFIVNNQTNADGSGKNAIISTYYPIILHYDVPQTVVFAATNCISVTSTNNQMNDGSAGCDSSFGSGDLAELSVVGMAAGATAPVFIFSHGWEEVSGTSLSTLELDNTNYGQNAPYESTVYT